MLKRYTVGYATRDGNTHEFGSYHLPRVAMRIEVLLQAKYGRSIAAYTYDNQNEERGSLALSNLNPSSRELFEVLGLLAELKIEDTEEDAIAKLKSR